MRQFRIVQGGRGGDYEPFARSTATTATIDLDMTDLHQKVREFESTVREVIEGEKLTKREYELFVFMVAHFADAHEIYNEEIHDECYLLMGKIERTMGKGK